MKANADRHEKHVAAILGGEQTIASGNKYEKLDVQVGRDDNSTWFRPLVECKATTKKSYSITRTLWRDICNRVMERSIEMIPGLAIRFENENGHVETDLLVMDLDVVAELLARNAEVDRMVRDAYDGLFADGDAKNVEEMLGRIIREAYDDGA